MSAEGDTRDKRSVRARARFARQAVPADERAVLAAAACERALAIPGVAAARHVLGFAAAPEELDPAPLLDALRTLGATICLPRITGPGSLALHVCETGTALESGPFGLRQPSDDAPPADTDAIDLVIAPGVAFDVHGNRLGFGGGFYDRLLSGMPEPLRVALAFDGQVVERVPTDAHDEPVDFVVTPTRTLETRARARGRA